MNLEETPRLEDYELETIVAVREAIPELSHLSVHKIHQLWSAYSESMCTGWLNHGDARLEEFWEWCCEETYDEGDY